MRIVPAKMTEGWKREDKTGPYRPTARVTIQRINLQRFPYDTAKAAGGDWTIQRHRKGTYTSVIFGEDSHPSSSCRGSSRWTGTARRPGRGDLHHHDDEHRGPAIGEVDPDPTTFDSPGAFTYNRGMRWTAVGPEIDPDAADDEPVGLRPEPLAEPPRAGPAGQDLRGLRRRLLVDG